MLMPFGKHKGQNVRTLPKKYLQWLVRTVSLRGQLRNEVRNVLYGEPIPILPPVIDINRLVKDFETTWEEINNPDAT
jgi:Putative quorum-sensing-regulated virulence factor